MVKNLIYFFFSFMYVYSYFQFVQYFCSKFVLFGRVSLFLHFVFLFVFLCNICMRERLHFLCLCVDILCSAHQFTNAAISRALLFQTLCKLFILLFFFIFFLFCFGSYRKKKKTTTITPARYTAISRVGILLNTFDYESFSVSP